MANEITDADLDAIEARANAATPGPWRPTREPPPVGNDYFDRHCADGSTPIESTGTSMALGVAVGVTSRRPDADFIAAARADIPALVTALRAARKKVAEYRDEATRCRTLAKHVLEYAGTNGVLIEFGESPTFDTGIGILICAPNLDENNLGEAASTVVKEIFEHVGEDIKKLSIGKSIVIGANGDSK